jgi:transcriptional regulator with XRE-family HTH domain
MGSITSQVVDQMIFSRCYLGMNTSTQELTNSLRQARRSRRLSQLELSLRLGVSQRHVSFVESGRARPSRELLAAWLTELALPMVVFNEVMAYAGYSGVFTSHTLSDPAMRQANAALERLLAGHDPMPGIVIDANWNLVRFNRGARWLVTTLMPWGVDAMESSPVNVIDLLAHPEGFTKGIINLEEVGPPTLAHLRHEAASRPRLVPKVDAFEELLKTRLGEKVVSASGHSLASPVMTTRYATPMGELAFFSMFTTFGTPHDITLGSLRVEHMFAADDATRLVVEHEVGR